MWFRIPMGKTQMKHETKHRHQQQEGESQIPPQPKHDSNNNNKKNKNNMIMTMEWWWKEMAKPRYDGTVVIGACLVETVFCLLIIRYIEYTEIDWVAYMQEVEGWLINGEYDYRKLRGDTGPLVYPAGFLYLFALLRHLTNEGTNVLQAQYIFVGIYVLQLFVVLLIYTKVMRCRISSLSSSPTSTATTSTNTTSTNTTSTKLSKEETESWQYSTSSVWSWRFAMGLLCLSKRLHSIFVLRLFNDGVAMLFFYISLYLFMVQSWKWGCAWFSLAVSIKMNILLFAPGLLLLLLQTHDSLYGTIRCLSICATIQFLVGAPFLLSYPESYLRKAFELDRTFFYQWTVNWKFLSEDTFLSKPLALILLTLHLGTLCCFAILWIHSTRVQCCNNHNKKQMKHKHNSSICLGKPLKADYIVYTMLVSNFVGIVFARTLHYQFYAWYFHAIPLLLWISYTPSSTLSLSSWCSIINTMLIRTTIWAMIEYAFNVFPATPLSSTILQMAHVCLLFRIKAPHQLNMTVVLDDDNEEIMSHTTTTTSNDNVKME